MILDVYYEEQTVLDDRNDKSIFTFCENTIKTLGLSNQPKKIWNLDDLVSAPIPQKQKELVVKTYLVLELLAGQI